MWWFIGSLLASFMLTKAAMRAAERAAAESQGTLVNKDSNSAGIPVIYGERKVGGTRVNRATAGSSNKYQYIVLVLGEGEVEEIGNVWIDDTLSTDSKYSGLVTVVKHLGDDSQAADSMLMAAGIDWNTTDRLRGTAYLAIRLKYDQDDLGTTPTITAMVKGRKVYDPRTATTAWSDNPALCLRDYLTNDRFGKGLPTSAINDTQFSAAADDCDEIVTPFEDGTARERFKCNTVIDVERKIIDNVKDIVSGMRAHVPYENGQYGLIVEGTGTSSYSFTEDHVIGDLSVTSEDKSSRYNLVVATFTNAENEWQEDQVQYPEEGNTSFLDADAGFVSEHRIDLPVTTDPYSATDLAEVILKKSRESMGVKFTSTSEALNVSVGDIIDITHSTPGWVAKPFRVSNLTLNVDGTVDVEAIEHQDNIYPWIQQTENATIPDTVLQDPSDVAPVTNLITTPAVITGTDGTFTSVIDIAWDAADDGFVVEYLVTVTPSSGSVQTFKTPATDYRFFVADFTVTYTISVRAVTAIGARSAPVTDTPATPIGDTVAPGVPTATNITGTFQKFIVKWTNPTDLDFSHVEVKRSATSNEIDGTVVGQTKADSWLDAPYTGAETRWFWLRSVDVSGNASVWVSVGSATTIRLIADDFDDGVITPDFISTAFDDLLAAKAEQVDLDVETARITSVVNEQQDIGNTIDTVAERMLTLATTQSDTLGKISDAGITVDPSTGVVTIQAVETLRSQTETSINNVQVDLDAAEASILLKASTTYVNNEIAAAVLDSADLASLNDLEAKVNQAEIDIDGAEADILLKADSTTVSALDVRVGQAEIDIDANESAILLKASSTDLNSVESRVTTAETTLGALDIAAITNTVVDTRSLHNKVDANAVTNLKQLLAEYNNREAIKTDLAYARQEISADVDDANTATAAAKLELAALIEDNAALITSEQTARADADTAIASDITTLQTNVDDNTSLITTEQTARSDGDTALGQRIDTLQVEVDTNAASIVTEQTARADADTAISSNVTTLETTVNGHSTSISTAQASINGISAQYSVTIDNNGHVSGYGLVSDIIAGNPTSAFIVNADQFAIGASGNYPFVYYANDTTVTKDGEDYVLTAGTYIKDANIQKGAITDAHIQNLTAESITVASLDGLSTDLGTITAGKLENADQSFVIDLTNKTIYIR